MEAALVGKPVIKVLAICGSLRKGSYNRGLVRSAIELCRESINGIQVEYVEIPLLPMLNTDLEVKGTYPPVVEAFRQKILEADSILFASTHLNQSSQRPAAIFGSVSPLWTLSFHTIDHEASISTSAEGIDSLPWLKISKFNDFLILGSFRCPEMASLEVWAMKEYGIKGSWSKIFVIPILAEIRDRLFLGHWGPWYFTKSGDIVMKVDWGEKLIIYNPKQRTYEVTFISDSVQLVPYVESLIPPVCFDSM